MSDGTIKISADLDSKKLEQGLKRAEKQVETLTQKFDRQNLKIKEQSVRVDELKKKLEKAKISNKPAEVIEKLQNQVGLAEDKLALFNKEADNTAKKINQAENESRDFEKAIELVQKAEKKAAEEAARIAEEEKKAAEEAEKVAEEVKKIPDKKKIDIDVSDAYAEIDKISKHAGENLKKAASVIKKGMLVAAGAIGAGFAKGVTYNAEIEQYKTSFEVMTGSAEKAMEVVEDLKAMGAATPFELPDLAETTQLLMNYGFTADEAKNRMSMLGDIAQGNAEKMNRIAMAYGQMSSAGKVQLEDVKQMIEAGFNPLQEISQTTGESMESLYERISKGTIAVDEITASMQRSTSEGGKYFQSMEKQSKTASGQFSTLKDNINSALGAMAEGASETISKKLLPALNNSIGKLTSVFKSEEFKAKIDSIISDILSLGRTIKPFAQTTLKILVSMLEFTIKNFKTLAIEVGIAWGAFKIWKTAGAITTVINASRLAFDGMTKAQAAQAVQASISAMKTKSNVAATAAQTLATATGTAATVTETAATAASTTALTAKQVVVGVLSGKIGIVTAAQWLWNAAMTANPIGAVIMLVAALAAGIVALTKVLSRETEEEKEHRLAVEETIDAINERKQALEESQSAFAEDINSTKVSYDHTKDLADELFSLADANGNVDKANRARAEFILGELNTALGTEYTLNGNQIQQYDELKDSVYGLIEAKKAEAYMDAYKDQYTEALKNQAAAQEELTRVKAEHGDVLLEERKRLDEIQAVQDLINEKNEKLRLGEATGAEAENLTKEVGALEGYLGEISERLDIFYDENEKAFQAISDAENNVQQTNQTITGYETAMEMLAEGNTAGAIEAIENLGGVLGDSEIAAADFAEGSKEALGKAGAEYQLALEALVQALKTYEDEPSESAARMVMGALNTFQGAKDKYIAVGGQMKNWTITGWDGVNFGVDKDVSLLTGDLKKLEPQLKKASADCGKNFNDGYIESLTEADFGTTAAKKGDESVKGLNKGIDAGSPSRKTENSGLYFVQGFQIGIAKNAWRAIAQARLLGLQAHAALKKAQEEGSPSKKTKRSGQFFAEGFSVGILGKIKDVADSAKKMAQSAISSVENVLQGDTVSKVSQEIASMVADGISIGIEDAEYEVSDDVQKLFDDLDLQYDLGVIGEKDYYERLLSLRDTYIKKYTKQWWDYTQDILDYEKKTQEEAQKQHEEYIENLFDDLEWQYDLGIISEEEYYEKLIEFRDKYFEEGSDEWREYTKKIIDFNEKLIEEAEQWQETALKLEEDLTKELKSLNDEKLEIEEKYSKERRELRKDTLEKISDLEDKYNTELADREKEIYNSFGLFAKAEREYVSGYDLKSNLRSQLKAQEDFDNALERIKEQGGSEEFIEELKAMGVNNVDEIVAISKMSKAALEEYMELWQEKKDYASEKAIEETESLRVETDVEIQNVKDDAKKQYENLKKEEEQEIQGIFNDMYNLFMEKVTDFKDIGSELMNEVIKGIREELPKMDREIENAANAAIEELNKKINPQPLTLSEIVPENVNIEMDSNIIQQTTQSVNPVAQSGSQELNVNVEGSYNAVIEIDGKRFARFIQPFLEKETRRIGPKLIERTV